MSKFSGLLQAKQAQPLPAAEVPNSTIEPVDAQPEVNVEQSASEVVIETPPEIGTPVAVGSIINMQPPRGKKGHPDYNQVTIYLKKETHNKAKIALLQNGGDKDFSELVEELVGKWLEG